MKESKPSILYLTDLYYPAKGRNYYEEDLYITSVLKDDFDIIIAHPTHSKRFEKIVDLVVFRNTGPVLYYREYFQDFLKRTLNENIATYNTMAGKADTLGKQYLVDLYKQGYPIIPTIDTMEDIELIPQVEKYIIKIKQGADSVGMSIVSRSELEKITLQDQILQPFIDFNYEVSFYYIDSDFQYALYAPDKNKRWILEEYLPTSEDFIFAQKFISWNAIRYGIQRVDACRTEDGGLFLVELEDLNPYLSLHLLSQEKKHLFLENFKKSLLQSII